MVRLAPALQKAVTQLSGSEQVRHTLLVRGPAASGKTVSSVYSIGHTATISDAAKAAYAAKAAVDVSSAQGFAVGKYDLTTMSLQQLLDVTNDMILNHGVSAEALKPMTDLIGDPYAADFNDPVNVLSLLSDQLHSARTSGDIATASSILALNDMLDDFRPHISAKDAAYVGIVAAAYAVDGSQQKSVS